MQVDPATQLHKQVGLALCTQADAPHALDVAQEEP